MSAPTERPTDRDYDALHRAGRRLPRLRLPRAGRRSTSRTRCSTPRTGPPSWRWPRSRPRAGGDPEPHRAEAAAITAAMVEHLYDDGIFQSRDLRTGCLDPLQQRGRAGPAHPARPAARDRPRADRHRARPLRPQGRGAAELRPDRAGVRPGRATGAGRAGSTSPGWSGRACKDRRPDLAASLADNMINAVATVRLPRILRPGHPAGARISRLQLVSRPHPRRGG